MIDRDDKGRFIKGNAGGPGRPRNQRNTLHAKLLGVLEDDDFVRPVAWFLQHDDEDDAKDNAGDDAKRDAERDGEDDGDDNINPFADLLQQLQDYPAGWNGRLRFELTIEAGVVVDVATRKLRPKPKD